MTATWGANGAASNGTDSCTPAYPTGITAGQLLVLAAAWGNDGDEPPDTPSGWSLAGSVVGGSGAFGSGVGPRGMSFYTTEATGSETGTLTVTNASGSAAGRAVRAYIHRYTKSLTYWAPMIVVGGADTSVDTSWSVTAASDPGLAVGDVIHVGSALATTGTPAMSSVSVTWPGTTGTQTAQSSGSATGGHQVRLIEHRRTVATGPSSGAPSFTATLSTAAAGVTALARVRDSATDLTPGPPEVHYLWDGTDWVLAEEKIRTTAGTWL